MIIVDGEYCTKCEKYMQYNEKGKCIKCGTLIYKTQKEKNSYIGISKDDATSIKGEGDFNGDNIC